MRTSLKYGRLLHRVKRGWKLGADTHKVLIGSFNFTVRAMWTPWL